VTSGSGVLGVSSVSGVSGVLQPASLWAEKNLSIF
jgi:hypothetical protein